MKKIIIASMLAGLSLNAAAYFDGGAGVVSGAHGYRGSKLYLVVGSEPFYLKPMFNSYKADGTGGTFKTYSLRGGYDRDIYGVGAEFGSTSKLNGYQNSFFGGDITFTLTPDGGGRSRLAGPRSGSSGRGGKGVTRVDVGAAVKLTAHKDRFTAAKTETINQTDLSLFAGAKILSARVSGTYTRSSYDKTLSAASIISVPKVENITGLNNVIQGFPVSSWNFGLAWSSLPMVSPFLSYTRTTFKLSQKTSKAYMAGATIDISMLAVNVSYELYDDGSTKDGFYSVGAGLRF
ncbi:MAG: hypothetical protein A2X28_10760 [Elusimicrobia bacterium GWA2_56_46]|nr:MAG: hypothetical protein A2X28_10760 [Elusimicrobia bacterium GWA2_56_46]OGR55745.1 MAG: hypothetical protein A2X39_10380 [Elusimicrobia bacterium GWC2_56_31]HBB66107.1 hypothetical protein [Elusimicrobiota bacterium]